MFIVWRSRGDPHRPRRCSSSSRYHYPGARHRGRALSHHQWRLMSVYFAWNEFIALASLLSHFEKILKSDFSRISQNSSLHWHNLSFVSIKIMFGIEWTMKSDIQFIVSVLCEWKNIFEDTRKNRVIDYPVEAVFVPVWFSLCNYQAKKSDQSLVVGIEIAWLYVHVMIKMGSAVRSHLSAGKYFWVSYDVAINILCICEYFWLNVYVSLIFSSLHRRGGDPGPLWSPLQSGWRTGHCAHTSHTG